MTTSDDPVPDAPGGADDDERTDPETPTGLRRSLAAQSADTQRWREVAFVAQQEIHQLNARATVATITCNQLRHRLGVSIALNVLLALLLLAAVVLLVAVAR